MNAAPPFAAHKAPGWLAMRLMKVFASTAPCLRPRLVEYPSYAWSPMRLAYKPGSAGPRVAVSRVTPGCQSPPASAVILTFSVGGSTGSWAAAIVDMAHKQDVMITVTRMERNIMSFSRQGAALVRRLSG